MDQKIKRAQRAIQQLQIRVDQNSSVDKLQLADILVDFLDYPDSRKGEEHAIACKMGNYDVFETRSQLAHVLSKNEKAVERNMVCQCCGLFIHTETIPYCTRLSNINVGLGTRLYLNSLLYNALIFIVATTIFSIYCIITNMIACRDWSGGSCQIQGISLSYKIKKPNEYDNTFYTSSVLGIVLVSIWGIIEVVKNHHEKNIQVELTNKFIQASELTLMLEKFPSSKLNKPYDDNLHYLQRIFDQYKQKIETQTDFKIVKFNIARNLYMQRVQNKERIDALNKQLKEKQDVFRQWIIQRQYHNRFLCTQRERQEKYDDYLNFYINKYDIRQSYHGQQDQNVILFVTFQQSRAREEIQYNARSPHLLNCFNLCHKKTFPIEGLRIKKAPPPEQIKWKNVGFPFKTKLLRIFLVYGISLLLLAASLAITYGLNQVQNDNPNVWVSILISVVITGINFAIQFVIMLLSKYLNEITETNIQFNIAFKICLFQILNVIGVPLLALYISKRNLYGQSGLSQDIFFIALFNILPPLGRFIDPYYILITLRNKIYARPVYRLKNFQSQQQFNKIYEANDFDLGYEYAYILKTSIFTSFFMTLQPVITIFAVIGLLLMFQVNKYRILYRFFKPRFYSATVNNLVNHLLNLSPMIFALGMLVFINWQKDYYFSGNYYITWVIFIIGGFFFIFPFKLLYKCIPEPHFPQMHYNQQKPILPSQYDRMNPVTKSKALDQHRSYLKELEDKHQLPEQARLQNQTVIRNTSVDQRKSKLAANELRLSMRNSRIQKIPQQSFPSHLNENPYGSGIYQKPVYNDNLQSYHNFVSHQKDRSSI